MRGNIIKKRLMSLHLKRLPALASVAVQYREYKNGLFSSREDKNKGHLQFLDLS